MKISSSMTLLLISISTAALSQEYKARAVPMHINVTYYDCVLPKDVVCIAGTENDKKKCSHCQTWQSAEFNQYLTSTVDHDAYLYSKGNPRANQFLVDVKNSLENGGTPDPVRVAPTFAAIYKDPRSYGLLAVETSEPTDGFLVSNKNGGILIRTSDRNTLIHPSDEKNGDLWMNPPQLVFGSHTTKLMVPIQPILQQRKQKPSLTWNAWIDDPPDIALKPVDVLQKEGHDYHLVLDLAGLAYRSENQRPAGGDIIDWLAKWLDNTNYSTVGLTVVMLADSHFTPSIATYKMPVDLVKLRAWRNNPRNVAGSPFDELRRQPDGISDFVFGRAEFAVRTTGKPGRAAVTFSIWNDSGRPVDELSASFCVSSCEGVAYSSGLMGIDSVSPSLASDAALHLVQVGTRVSGIFHRSDKPFLFDIWDVSPDRTLFVTALRDVMKEFIEGKESNDRLIAAEKFADAIFPPDMADARRVRANLNNYINSHITSGSPPPAQRALSFYVRMLAITGNPVPAVPFGLYPITEFTSQGDPELSYLGFYFRIENPLEIQSYEFDGNCIKRWVLVYSDKGPEELTHAALALSANVISKWPSNGSFHHFATMRGEEGFGKWIRTKTGDDPEAAIFILGHRGEEDGISRIILNDGDILKPNDVRRVFQRPSVAILNACGTAMAGAEDFVRAFNSGNVTAVIATKYEVAPAMAVQFAQCLNEQIANTTLSSPGSTTTNLSYAVFDAAHCLRKEKAFRMDDPTKTVPGAVPWGARALAYSLIGNGGMMLCMPEGNHQ
jgi:hypothetical protein